MIRCWVHDRTYGDGWRDWPTLAVAVFVCQPSGNQIPLCKRCLDTWLDNVDDDPEGEPSELRWLASASSEATP